MRISRRMGIYSSGSRDGIRYYGTATPLSSADYFICSVSSSALAIFASNAKDNAYIDTYDASLTKGSFEPVNYTSGLAGAFNGTHIILCSSAYANVIDPNANEVAAYTDSGVKTVLTTLSVARNDPACVCIGNYTLIAGGNIGTNDTYSDVVDVYNKSLTLQLADKLSKSRDNILAASTSTHAVLACGSAGSSVSSNYVDYYDTSLTHTSDRNMPLTTYNNNDERAITFGNVAVFIYEDGLVVCDELGTWSTHELFTSYGRYPEYAATTVLMDNLILAGGSYSYNSTPSLSVNNVDMVSSSFVISSLKSLPVKRGYMRGATVGDFALFGGGGGSPYTDVYVYNYKSSKKESV